MDLATELGAYLAGVFAADGPVEIAVGAQNEEAGFSSETTVYTASWSASGEAHEQRQVLKREPTGVTVFKDTSVERQVRAMQVVAEQSAVPVPAIIALETDASIMGAPFYVMEAVEGQVPPDNPPFSTGGWIFEADEADQRQLHTSGLDAVADLHAIEPSAFDFLDRPMFGEPGPDQMLGQWEDMLAWGRADEPLPVIDHAMAWLRTHQPDDEAAHDIRLSWGDSRISNIIWQDFRPAAIIDWEMAELAPPAADVVWYRHIDRTMEGATDSSKLPGFLDLDEIVAHYEARTGRTLTNIRWYEVYAAMRFGVVMMRIARRMVEQYDLDPSLMHNNLGVRALAEVLDLDSPGEPGPLG